MTFTARRLLILTMVLGSTASVLAGIIETASYAHHTATFLAFCALVATVAVAMIEADDEGGAT